jgi:hypothetical protein
MTTDTLTLEERAERLARASDWTGYADMYLVELEAAVAQEREALREIVRHEHDEWGTAQSAGARIGVCGRILAALDARESKR